MACIVTSTTTLAVLLVSASVCAQEPPPAQPAPAPIADSPATLAVPKANAPMPAAPGQAPAPGPVSVVSKFNLQIYGFAQLDVIRDSTQSFNDVAGNALIVRRALYGSRHPRVMFGVRHSRLGLKIAGAQAQEFKASVIAEMDFLGNQPANPPSLAEAAYFTSPTLRVRHMAGKLETPYVDVLIGQYWAVFGWQPYFGPASVQIQGLPGELFSRTPQVRLSHTFKTAPVNIEVALAAARPPQRDGDAPDGQGGLRLLINQWKGYRTAGATGTALDSAALGVSGAVRRFAVAELSATPLRAKKAIGWGVSIDGMIPVLPASQASHDNAITLTGSFVKGTGTSDSYTGLNGGVGFPSVERADGTTAPFAANIDGGLVTYDAAGNLHTIDWRSLIVGLQYYLPVAGIWIAGNYSNMHSGNIGSYGASSTSVVTDSWFADGCIFWDIHDGPRIGGEYAHTEQKYANDESAKNERFQLSAYYIF